MSATKRLPFAAQDSSDENLTDDLRDIGTDSTEDSLPDPNKKYDVEEILASRKTSDGATEYFIKWKDYPPHRNCWAFDVKPVALINKWKQRSKRIKQGTEDAFDLDAWEQAKLRRQRRRRKERERRRAEKNNNKSDKTPRSLDDSDDDRPIITHKRRRTDPSLSLDALTITSPVSPTIAPPINPSKNDPKDLTTTATAKDSGADLPSRTKENLKPKPVARKPLGGNPLLQPRKKSVATVPLDLSAISKLGKIPRKKAEPKPAGVQPFKNLSHENNARKKAAAERYAPPPADTVGHLFVPSDLGKNRPTPPELPPSNAETTQLHLRIDTQVPKTATEPPPKILQATSAQPYHQHMQPPGFIPWSCPYWIDRKECPRGTSCSFKHASCDKIASYELFRQADQESIQSSNYHYKFGFFNPSVICTWWLADGFCTRSPEECWYAHWHPEKQTGTAQVQFERPGVTCYFWAHQSCFKRAEDCKYKHEVTGVIAHPPQGVKTLDPRYLRPELAHLVIPNRPPDQHALASNNSLPPLHSPPSAGPDPLASLHTDQLMDYQMESTNPQSAGPEMSRPPSTHQPMDFQMESTIPQQDSNKQPARAALLETSGTPVSAEGFNYTRWASPGIDFYWASNHVRAIVTVPVALEAILNQAGASFSLEQLIGANSFSKNIVPLATGKLLNKKGDVEQLEELFNSLKKDGTGFAIQLPSSSTDLLLIPAGQECWSFLPSIQGKTEDYDVLFYALRRGALPVSAHPVSAQPASVQPASVQPTSVQPTSVQPTAIQPAPVQSAPDHPASPLFAPVSDIISAAAPNFTPGSIHNPEVQSMKPYYSEINLPVDFGGPKSFFKGFKQEISKMVYIAAREGDNAAEEHQQLEIYFESMGARIITDWELFLHFKSGVVIINPASHIATVSARNNMHQILRGPHNIFQMGWDTDKSFVCRKVFPGGSVYFLTRNMFERKPHVALQVLKALHKRSKNSRSWKLFLPERPIGLIVPFMQPGNPQYLAHRTDYENLLRLALDFDIQKDDIAPGASRVPKDPMILLPDLDERNISATHDLLEFIHKTFELYRTSRRFIVVCPDNELESEEIKGFQKKWQHVHFPTNEACLQIFRTENLLS